MNRRRSPRFIFELGGYGRGRGLISQYLREHLLNKPGLEFNRTQRLYLRRETLTVEGNSELPTDQRGSEALVNRPIRTKGVSRLRIVRTN